jgi:hypothetical protein
MARFCAIDAVAPAIERTKAMLLRPFRFKTWMIMGIVGWLGGGSAGGGFNFSFPSNWAARGKRAPRPPSAPGSDLPMAMMVAVIAVFALVALAIGIAFLYLFSRFRFVLFDCVMSGQIGIERGWKIYQEQAQRYFWLWFWAAMAFFVFLGAAVGIPLLIAYRRGVFATGPPSLEAIFTFVGIIVLALLVIGLVMFTLTSLAKDFFVPLMALDNLTVGQAWAALKLIIRAEPWNFAGYLGLKLLLSMVAAFAMAIPLFALLLVVIIAGAMVAVISVVLVQHPGAALIGAGIVFVVIAAIALVVIFLSLIIFLSAPVAVFFTSYALYFFGGRYPKLGELLWPSPVLPPSALVPEGR